MDVKMVILANQHLGMVVQWQDRFYKAIRAHTYFGHKVSTLLLYMTGRVRDRVCGIIQVQSD